jgi:hypothetical protein
MVKAGWKPLDPDIADFLTAYESENDSAVGERFTDRLLTADPRRIAVVDRADLVAALPARRQMFANAGVGALRRTDAAQLELDEHHLLVSTEWTTSTTATSPPC